MDRERVIGWLEEVRMTKEDAEILIGRFMSIGIGCCPHPGPAHKTPQGCFQRELDIQTKENLQALLDRERALRRTL